MMRLIISGNSFLQLIKRLLAGAFLSCLLCHSSLANDLPKCDVFWQSDRLFQYDFDTYLTSASELNTLGPIGYYQDQPVSEEKGNFSYPDYVTSLHEYDRKFCQKEITILVFMAANNDLTPYAFWDLTEMEAGYLNPDSKWSASSTTTSDLLVDFQSRKHTSLKRLHMFQSPNPYWRKRGLDHYQGMDLDDILSPVAYYAKERTGTTEEQFYDFIRWGIENYPSERYMVIVWGHGQGFTSLQRENVDHDSYLFAGRFGGLAFQEESNDYLTTPALARVLKRVKEEIFDNKDQIDIYASDACLMQMLEVAYEISSYTDYIVGSAQIQSYLGMPYRTIMSGINRGTFAFKESIRRKKCHEENSEDIMSCFIAHMIPELTSRTVYPKYGLQALGDPNAYKEYTVSSLRSSVLEKSLVKYMNVFGRSMLGYLDANGKEGVTAVQKALRRSLRFIGDGVEITTAMLMLNKALDKQAKNLFPADPNYVSKKEYMDRLIRINLGMLREIKNLSIASAHGEFYDLYLRRAKKELRLDRLASLALWIPKTQEDLDERIEDFRNSRLYKQLRKRPNSDETYWEAWMRRVLPHEDDN